MARLGICRIEATTPPAVSLEPSWPLPFRLGPPGHRRTAACPQASVNPARLQLQQTIASPRGLACGTQAELPAVQRGC
jgi:hypothetical protein